MIDIEQVRKVALLGRLELTAQEEIQFSAQLSSILDYFEQLSELDTTNVEPTTRAIELNNITRGDQQISYQEREALLDQAPQRDEDFFRVPKILGGDDS